MPENAPRGPVPFSWATPTSYEVFPYLAEISLREFHLDPKACTESFRRGGKRIREIFPDLAVPACYCPPLSYGHLACLGAEVIFPENGAPAVRPVCGSMDACHELLDRETPFEENPLFRFYLKLWEHLRREFPEDNVSFSGFGKQGPVTSAVLLRGQDFFLDLYDHPERTAKFLERMTKSIVRFRRFLCGITQAPTVAPSAGIADDFAALVSPGLWPEFVLPFWKQQYLETTNGIRTLHCEDLSPAHLPLLETLGLSHFDPDKSSRLTPKVVADAIRIPFSWSLQSFDYPQMTTEQIREWVTRCVSDGASRVYSYIYVNMCAGDIPAKVHAFIETSKGIVSRQRSG